MLTEERKNRLRESVLLEQPDVAWYAERKPKMVLNQTYLEHRDIQLHERLRGKVASAIIDSIEPFIGEDDLLAGRLHVAKETEEERIEREALDKQCEGRGRINGTENSATGHRVIDFEKLLAKGVNGVLAEVKARRSAVEFSDPDAAEKRSFYDACMDELEAVLRCQERYHAQAVRMWEAETNAERKQELKQMADALAKVPAEPAETFMEAMQSMWFVEFILGYIRDTTLTGRPDNYLYPYYQKDIAEGRITDDEVFSLIEDLYFKHNNVYSSWPASIMVGGRKRNGETNWNELSYMFVRAIGTTGLVNPSVAVCYNEDMPEDLLDLSLEMIAQGHTRPSFFNDDVVIKGLKEAGVSEEDANYYIHSTCVEITPIAASNICVATPYINLNKGLEYILNGGEKIFGNDFQLHHPVEVNLDELDTFDKFYAEVKAVIDNILKGTLAEIQDLILYRKRYSSSPLASCFINDCLELGKDAAAGGGRYSFVYPCFPGFINLLDSLSAIKKVVYEEKMATLQEIRDAIKDNFENEERLHAFLVNRCPKFGNDIPENDKMAKDLFLYIKEELDQFENCVPNGKFYTSYFAWIQHGVLGEQGAATPDGRLQGEALSEHLGAFRGMDKNGPLAVMNSISGLPQHYGIGGIATNFRFSKKMMREGFEQIKAFLKEFMNKGNFEAQFNVVDQETLLDAQKHPEKYKTLLVRVAGYSDYFVNLLPVIQNEIIERMEHDEF